MGCQQETKFVCGVLLWGDEYEGIGYPAILGGWGEAACLFDQSY